MDRIWAGVLVDTPDGIPLVRDHTKPLPHYWKVPGGKGERGETPSQCAARELLEETGVCVHPYELLRVFREEMGSYSRHGYRVSLPGLPAVKDRGDEGEEVKVFLPEQLWLMRGEILPAHLPFFQYVFSRAV